MQIWAYTLISVVILSAISFVGGLLILFGEKKFRYLSLFLVSFAVGALFGDAFIHILPESFKDQAGNIRTSLFVVAGVLVFFVLEKFVRWRHCHMAPSVGHEHPFVSMNIVGDGIHNLIDGMLIGASYLVSIPIGIATTLAIILHEIPQELGDFSIFIHGGLSARRAIFFNFLLSLTGIFGAIISLLIGEQVGGYAAALLPITAGGFLYIAGSDLIPELHHETKISTSLGQLISIICGVAVMALLVFI
ncbi:MAG: ZIP family metal transporter [bacterium]